MARARLALSLSTTSMIIHPDEHETARNDVPDIADILQGEASREPGREELLKWLRAFRGRLPADFKFDRDEVNSR